jgi:UDP-2-acetamido-3-amino-2,3-dideoxy-glucuronate N-acetyltransferase
MSNAPFMHPQALCESKAVGAGTRIWAFAHVLPGARIGKDCNICDGVFVENDVTVGDRVTVKCGVQLWDGITLEDDVFVGPNATFSNDPFPRSRQRPAAYARTRVESGASIGANATILPGLSIGQHAMVGAGAVVTRSVPPYAIVSGNPARITGYVNASGSARSSAAPQAAVGVSAVRGVKRVAMKSAHDLRGRLAAGETGPEVPFEMKRFFVVYGVPSAETRGEHAHLRCQQLLVCVKGRVNVVVDDGRTREEHILDDPAAGLYVPPMVWATQYRYSEDAVLLVLASEPYDPADYIRDYRDFLARAAAV